MSAARWACVVAALGAAAYLLLDPATADHAAQEYRAGLGLGLWDNGWFAGHHTPAYSVLSPPLGALLGPRVAGALAAVAAAGLFGLLAERHWGARAASVAAVWFAVGCVATLVSGRLTFLLGVAIGLGALLALQRDRRVAACALAVATSLASPVAAVFLAIAALAAALAAAATGRRPQATSDSMPSAPAPPATEAAAAPGRRPQATSDPMPSAPAPPAAGAAAAPGRRPQAPSGSPRSSPAAAVAAAALGPAALLAVLFPEGGTEPFVASAFWPALAATILVAVALPARERTLRIGAALYALACVAVFVAPTPLGGNATRLGALVAGPILAGAVLASGGRRAALLALALPLAYWQLYPATRDVVRASGDPSTAAAYYAPLLAYLKHACLPDGGGRGACGRGSLRTEIPFTENHWEAAHVAPHLPLARGWERQFDRRYGALFYDGSLDAASYRAWLDEHAVAYVAVPDAPLDDAGRDEARLVARGLGYLRPVWRNAHWRVFAVRRPVPLVTGAARTIALGDGGFEIHATRPGDVLVRVRYTRWWAVTAGHACVRRGPGAMTLVRVEQPGTVDVRPRIGGAACRR